MPKKYIDLLLVEDEEETQYLVSAPSYEAGEGSIVRFMCGTMGTVTKKAWLDPEGEVYGLISSVFPIYDAEAIYRPQWCKEQADAAS